MVGGTGGTVDEVVIVGTRLPRIEIVLASRIQIHIGGISMSLGDIGARVGRALRDANCGFNPKSCDDDLPDHLKYGSGNRNDDRYYDVLRDGKVQAEVKDAASDTAKSGRENSFWAIPNKDGSYSVYRNPEGIRDQPSSPMKDGKLVPPNSPYGIPVYFHTHPAGYVPGPGGNDTSSMPRTALGVVLSPIGIYFYNSNSIPMGR
jgi:hypothetical protein